VGQIHSCTCTSFGDVTGTEKHRTSAHSCALARTPSWLSRIPLAHAIHALSMCVYFLQWTPKWAPQYVRELEKWLVTSA
jgi:hypothetical protein